MASRITTLAVGHVTHDRFGEKIASGGCAYYAARTWKALGADSRLLTAVGRDFAGEDVGDKQSTRVIRGDATTVFTNLYPESGPRVQYVEAVAPSIGPDRLPPVWRDPDVLFLGPVLGEVEIGDFIDQSRARLVAIGVQGYIRAAAFADETGKRRVIPRPWSPTDTELRRVDVACLSDEDLAGQGNLFERLCANVPIVALTHERKGCDIIEDGNRTWVGIHPAREVDPTGAGDTFAAGFLYGLATGRSTAQAARLGAACASIIIEAVAGEAFPRMDEAFSRAERISIRSISTTV